MKSYEILPAGMTGSAMGRAAKAPKSYEILPGAGAAEQGLVGWTKGASAIARGVSTYGATSNQGIGLLYDPAGMAPTYRGVAEPIAGNVYEFLPASMTGSAKESKSYEILPGARAESQGLGGKRGGCGGKSDDCGCGGKCGGGERAKSTGQFVDHSMTMALNPAAFFGGIKGGLQGGGPIGIGSGNSGPSARPCWFIESRIIGLREEIADRRRRFGPRIDDVSAAWRRARDSCQPISQDNPCAGLAAALMSIDPNEDVPRYNALVNMRAQCGMNHAANRAVWQALVCNVLTTDARRREARAVQEQPPGDRIDYQYDIWPLEQEVLALEAQLRVCERAATSPPGAEPFASCSGIGSGGCSNGQKRCSYGNCDDGGDGCNRYISCGPGNWDPDCPATSNCGRY